MKPELKSFELQGEEISGLLAQMQSGKLVHACLITGEKGTGKKTLAGLMAQALLCRAEGSRPCGQCSACRMAEAGEHPDLIMIRRGIPIAPEAKKDRSTIPVDDIREMIRICGTRTMDGSARVVIISDADRMTPQAQNCLLKTLEEPPENTYLLLTTEHPEGVLTTVASRTRPVRLKAWPDEYILRVLEANGVEHGRALESAGEARGSVGKALDLATDEEYWNMREGVIRDFFGTLKRSEILRISNSWKDRKGEAESLMEILESVTRTMLEERLNPGNAGRTARLPANWQEFSRKAGPERFTALLDAVSEARRQLQANVNFQAVLEHLLFIWMGEGNQWSA